MFPYITCFCGCPIGDIYDIFKAMRYAAFKAANSDIDPAMIGISVEDLTVELGNILTMLHVKRECCRVRMLTQIEFKELY